MDFWKFLDSLIARDKRGESTEEIFAAAAPMFEKTFQAYLPKAPAECLLEMNEIRIAYLAALNADDPESCLAYMEPYRNLRFRVDLETQYPDIRWREAELRLKVVQVGPQDVILPTEYELAPIIEKLFAALKRDPSLQMELLRQPTLSPDEYKAYCDVQIAFYRAIARLPRDEAVLMLRDVYRPTDA
jgi:hypothetical protein